MKKPTRSLCQITGLTILLVVLISTGTACVQPLSGSPNPSPPVNPEPVKTGNDPGAASAGMTAEGEGFALYLTRDDIPPETMKALSHVDIAGQPLLSLKDLISYNAQTHELKLTEEAFARIAQLEIPVRGRSFLVCIDKSPVYEGAFWTPVSSISFDGVTIWKPLGSKIPQILTLELGYPASSFYGGADPRNDPRVLESLKTAGKLIDRLSISDINKLPASFKGYELYSWPEAGRWHFSLITGTNRTKTAAEITSDSDYISEIGWIKIQAADVEAVKKVLSLLPRGESVSWYGDLHIGPAAPGGITVQLPPRDIADDIRSYAEGRGLIFSMAAY
jgi:hypothetical protein